MFFHGEIKNILSILAGSLLLAFGVVLFFVGNGITTGGSPGMALLLHHVTGYSIGSMMLLFNILLLLLGIKYLGKRFALRTVLAIVLSAFFIDLFTQNFPLESITHEMLLAVLFGGVLIGFGVGFILRGNASAGGSTVIAKIVAAHTEIRPSQVILFVDAVIIVSSVFVFVDLENALWSMLSIYVTAKAIDVVLSGRPTKKIVHLVTTKSNLLSQQIIEKLGYHGTIIEGRELNVKKSKSMIFIVVERNKLRVLRALVRENDPDAFMVVMDASELLGRGNA
jgi:uncharacterized membrane-anchored protein YitT (DUF2179 family)